MRRSQGYSQEEREWIMSEYLRLKRATGKSNTELAHHLGVNPSTIYDWKGTKWYEELSRKVNWQENTEIATGALNRLNELIQSEDSEVSLKALNVFARLNPDIRLNDFPSGKGRGGQDGVFDADIVMRMRRGSAVDGDDDDE